MPLVYGSKFDTVKIPTGSVGKYKYYSSYVAPQEFDMATFFNYFLTAIEVAISFTGIGAIATTALGVGFAAARAAVTSAVTGKEFDALSFGLDAATPFVTAVGGRVISGFRGISATRELRSGIEEINVAARNVRSAADKVFDALESNDARLGGIRTAAESVQTDVRNAQDVIMNVAGLKTGALQSHAFVAEQQLNKLGFFPKIGEVRAIGENLASKIPKNTPWVTTTFAKAHPSGWIGDMETGMRFTPGVSANEALDQAFHNSFDLLRQSLSEAFKQAYFPIYERFFSEALSHGIARAAEEGTENAIRNALKNGSAKDANSIIKALDDAIARGVGKMSELIRIILTTAARLGLTITEDIAKSIVELYAVRRGLVGAIAQLGIRKGLKGWVKTNKTEIFSLETAQELVKNIEQLGDFATDIPRHYISKISSKLAKAIQNEFKPLKDKLAKIFGSGKKLLREFERTGGVKVNSNVIVGYKILATEGITNQVQITFYPNATGSKDPKGKNHGGKKPVYVSATISQLIKLREGGMSYYLDTWAISKGGKAAQATGLQEFFNVMPVAAQLGASLVPIQKLAKIVGFVSTINRTINRYRQEGVTTQWSGFLEDTKQKAIGSIVVGVGKSIFGIIGMGTFGRIIGSTLAQIGKNAIEEGGLNGKKISDQISARAVGKARTYRSKTFKNNASIGRVGKRLYGTGKSIKAGQGGRAPGRR